MRGKAAAQSANRRAREAEERAEGLEASLRDSIARHRAEAAQLRTERDQARNRLVREVRQLSSAAVLDAEQRASDQIRAVREDCEERIARGLSWLTEALGDQLPSDVRSCAEAFGVDASVLINAVNRDGVFNRRGRRMSNKRLRHLDTIDRQQAAATDLPLLKTERDLEVGTIQLEAYRERKDA